MDLDNIDKILVTESSLTFTNGNNVQKMILTSDGIVESYTNNSLSNTMPFSKLGVIRECKGLVAKGYNLVEAELKVDNNDNANNENLLANPNKTKQELQQQIRDVDEIQALQNELEDKLDMLNEDTDTSDYIIVVYTNIDGDYIPDVALRSSDGYVAKDIDEAEHYDKETAEKIAEKLNNSLASEVSEEERQATPKFVYKAVSLNDVNSLKGLYEQKLVEDTRDENFPSTELTAEKRTAEELSNVNIEKDLTIEQIAWLQANIGNIYEIEDGLRNFSSEMNEYISEPIISLDDYFNGLKNELKGV